MASAEYRYIKREIRDTARTVRQSESMYQDEITSITDTADNGGEMEDLKARLAGMLVAEDITQGQHDTAVADANQVKTDATALYVYQATPAKATGTTANDYPGTPQLDWKCRRFMEKNIIIKCTDAANDLKFKVNTRTKEAGVDWEELTEKTLAHGDLYKVHLRNAHELVRVFLKTSVTDSHATFEVDPGGETV